MPVKFLGARLASMNFPYPDSVMQRVVMSSLEPSIGTETKTEPSGGPLETSHHMRVDP